MKRTTAIVACLALTAVSAPALAGHTVFGVTLDQTLVTWDSSAPNAILTGVAINGLASGETIRGIDFRPATGQLYALGSFNNLYTINTMNGTVSSVGAGPFAPALNGSAFGFDFNPTIDRIRVVSDANQNLVLHPDLGTATLATSLFYAPGDPNFGVDPNVVGSAYDNNFVGTMTSQLYGIDTGLDILVRQANSAGTLTTVGSLGADITNLVGFDISSNNFAYAASQDVGQSISMFWRINLMTGEATPVGQIGGGIMITSMAVLPAPSSLAVCGLAGLVATRRRR